MGCASSSDKGKTNVSKDRRRLSVGNVEAGQEAANEASTEENRGLISQLDEEDILAMAQAGEGRKMSIGSMTDQGKTSFANKSIEKKGDEAAEAYAGLGYTCRKGLKPEAPNQDSWMILQLGDFRFYAVYDGHGQKGHDVSQFVKDVVPKLIVRDERFKSANMGPMLMDVFKKTQSLVMTADRMKKLSAQMSGTTASVCIHDVTKKEGQEFGKITVAHVADSTVVLGKRGEDAKTTAVQLTRDHKPNLKDERARIEKAGGRVVFDGYANHRVYAKNARYPGLNMSRCMGDLMGHADCGCSCEPEIKDLCLEADDHVLLVCSDGVWEFLEPKDAVTLVSKFAAPDAQKAAEQLAKQAWDRWIREEGGAVVDDITVVLIYLKEQS